MGVVEELREKIGLKSSRQKRAEIRQFTDGEYIYAGVSGDRVKLGYSADLLNRIVTLSRQNAYPIDFVVLEAGTVARERELKRKYKQYKLHEEWFRYEGSLKAFVDSRRTDAEGRAVVYTADDARKCLGICRLEAEYDRRLRREVRLYKRFNWQGNTDVPWMLLFGCFGFPAEERILIAHLYRRVAKRCWSRWHLLYENCDVCDIAADMNIAGTKQIKRLLAAITDLPRRTWTVHSIVQNSTVVKLSIHGNYELVLWSWWRKVAGRISHSLKYPHYSLGWKTEMELRKSLGVLDLVPDQREQLFRYHKDAATTQWFLGHETVRLSEPSVLKSLTR